MNNTLKGVVMVVTLLVASIFIPGKAIEEINPGVLTSTEEVTALLNISQEILAVIDEVEAVEVAPGREVIEDVTEFIVATNEEAPEGVVEGEVSIHQLQDAQYSDMITSFVEDVQDGIGVSAIEPHVVVNNDFLDKEVLGFLPYWFWPSYSNDSLQYDKLSTIAYFGLTCGINGQWITDDAGYTAFYGANFTDLLAKAHANDTKVVVTVKNFDAQSITKLVTNVNGAGQTLIDNIVDVVRARGLDGVNIDFEYVASAEWPVDETLRMSFVAWHENLATRMHSEFPGSHVSTDVYASSSLYYKAYDMPALGASSLDYIMVMTYDFFTTNSSVAGPTAPLYGNQYWYTVSEAMNDIAAEAGAGKLIMGIPYYGLEFPVETTTYNSTRRVGVNAAIATFSAVLNPIYDTWHNSSTLRWEEADKVRWYVYRYPNMATDPLWQGYYEDEDTIAAKYDFMRSKSIGGVGIWALGYDNGYTALWEAIEESFMAPSFPVFFHSSVSEARVNEIMAETEGELASQESTNVWLVRAKRSYLTEPLMETLEGYREVSSVGSNTVDIQRGVVEVL